MTRYYLDNFGCDLEAKYLSRLQHLNSQHGTALVKVIQDSL